MKRALFLGCMIFVLPFIFVGCGGHDEELNFYQVFAEYNDEEKTLSCEQSVEYFNNSDNVLTCISFFVYANAFSQNEKPVSTAYLEKAYPNGKSYGEIEFSHFSVDGKEANAQMKSSSVLSVEMEKELFPNEKVTVDLNFTIKLANINHRLGYGDNAVNLGNFCPMVCVYQDGVGFIENSFATNGDPFCSDISNFEVEFKCDKEFVVAMSGTIENEKIENEKKIYKSKAQKVRDFAIVLSKDFKKTISQVGEVEVNYFYHNDSEAKQHLQIAVDALRTFEDLYGKYGYSQLSVVQTDFCFGGMEYPNLVMISNEIGDAQAVDYVIVHEIAHQWWYGMVGNNQFEESWIDEGLTEMSCALFYEKNTQYGIDYSVIMENAKATYKKFVEIYSKINGSVDESMNRNLNEFATEPEYVNCVYTKGMLLFDGVRVSMSDRKFFKCLADLFEKYCFKNITGEEVIESFSHTAHINLKPYFNAWLSGEVVIN